MLKNLKNRKKKGFTLVELVVVIAIIAILAAVLVPQITGYIKESRKTEVTKQAREIVTAVESNNVKSSSSKITDDKAWSAIQGNGNIASLIPDPDKMDKIPGTTTVEQLRQVVDSENYAFDIDAATYELLPNTVLPIESEE